MTGAWTWQVTSDWLRNQMPVVAKYAYFDHAAVSPLPKTASQAIQNYALQAAEHGDAHWLQWAAQVQDVRELAARLIAADPDEIALVGNTTLGIHWVAEGIRWEAGENVVVPANEFPSNLLPWRNLARRGVQIREVPVCPSGALSLDALADAIDSKTRVLAISWVGFASGYRVDVEQIVELAHSKGCWVLLDAIQGLGAFPLDVRQSDVDFVSADGHKWMLGPEGAGLLYIKSEHLERLTPLGVGWNSLQTGAFDPAATELKKNAARYEGGTMHMPGMLGFRASLQVLLEAGANRPNSPIAEAILNNVSLLERLLLESDFQVRVPEESHRSGIVGIAWPEASDNTERTYRAARKHLLQHGVVTSVRDGRLRVSTHAYNNKADCQRLVDALIDFRTHPEV